MHSTSFSQCSITEFFVMADVRNKFFVVDNYTEGDNIVFLYSCSVFSESRCRYILIMPHRLREFAYFIVQGKKNVRYVE